ncbi:MAG: LTA synthase family protein, partial [Muribaculaceae bacterium]|nr:LTA synthase family protein [Muribaculaceae bacterium]
SQIDLMPTLFALIGMEYDSSFYGTDILAPDYRERAFLATYEDLGYLEDGILTVLSPVRRVEQYRVVPTDANPYNTEPLADPDSAMIRRAIYHYQTSSEWYSPENVQK